ncbi:hypothetical protein CHI14_09310 [Paenibacillus sp. 7516]|nr:hypothetical protein CHI14_09310 [Paenibacillus sp. 7516]
MLSVTNTPDGDKGIRDVHMSSILYMKWDSRLDRVVLHTIEGLFYLPGPLVYWQNAMNSMGFKFLKVDRSTIINSDNIVKVDQIYKEAFFEHNVSRDSVKCEIAHHRYRKFVKELQIMNPSVILT